MLPLTNQKDVLEQLAQKIDGLLLTGGHDIEPSFYQQAKLEQCQVTCPLRDKMEKNTTRYFLSSRSTCARNLSRLAIFKCLSRRNTISRLTYANKFAT